MLVQQPSLDLPLAPSGRFFGNAHPPVLVDLRSSSAAASSPIADACSVPLPFDTFPFSNTSAANVSLTAAPAPPCTWRDLLPESTRGVFGRYLGAIYWAFAAMSTVGYGDLIPVNVSETGAVLIAEFAVSAAGECG